MYIDELFNLERKNVLITGSTRGIGFTLAKGLAKAGSSVILNGTNSERLADAIEQLKMQGFKVYGETFDVRNENEVREGIKKVIQEVGEIDILINNAGIQIRGPLEEFKLDDWQRVIDVNLTGVFLVSKAIVRDMILRRSGKIINICSIQSELARPSIAPYTASKGGVRNLTRAMATDWGKYNIQINGIAPGYIKTEMTKKLYQDNNFDSWLKGRTPANRWGNPEELIGAVIFLASKASDYVNGHLIYVDGGMLGCV